MIAIRRAFVPFAVVTVSLVAMSATSSRAADAAKPSVRADGDKPALHSTPPAHVSAPSAPEKERPVRVRETSPRRVAEKSSRDTNHKVNINTADVKTLMTLTGVGRRVAEKIVEYRDNHGPFKKADELRKVEGVGSGVWEKNRDRVIVK